MSSEIRTRIADGVTFHARLGGSDIPLDEGDIRAIGGILLGGAPGYARELRVLFAKGLLELGEKRRISSEALASILSCKPDSEVRLDPRAEISIFLSGDGVESTLGASEPITYFIPPLLDNALTKLSKLLQRAAKAMQFNELTRNVRVTPSKWLRTFERIYREQCAKPPLSEYLQVADCPENGFRLEIIKPLQTAQCPYTEARISICRADLPPGSKGELKIGIEALPSAARLVRRLNEDLPWPELVQLIEDMSIGAEVGDMLEALGRSKAIAIGKPERPDIALSFPPEAPLSALHLGHAGLMIGSADSCVLVDPWFLPAHPDYDQQPIGPRDLPKPQAILLTHEHWDHINSTIVLRYPTGVPIVVPRPDPDSPVRPKYREFLEILGCDQVVELGHWEKLVLDDGLIVTAIPFRGEGTAEHPSVRNCYLVERAGKHVFVHVDSSPDSHGHSDLTDGTIDRLVAEHGPADVVYATRRQEIHFGWECISDLYPVFLGANPVRLLDVVENCNCPADYLANLAEATRCSMMVLYSEGGAEWFPENTNFLRSDSSGAFSGYDHLWDTLDTISQAVPAPVRLSMPLDRLCLDHTGVTFIEGPLHE